ncbi:hypothetical protein M514_07818 [Trichuris suis]|uniref:DUF7041 domain-containing protein n=1 Tax=Trichuris suis TaxID=68888 RepID=A0A085M1X2_9BILA|nr:hypothetical protein M513_07818 [Trichuris suis]KFD64697.1 hypothetical protein M514_07818 [Trichuris suis]
MLSGNAPIPNDSTQHSENAVSLKLSTFWTSQPQVWFEQVEAQFNLHQISADTTKYYHVVSALDHDTACRVVDFLRHPPASNKYDSLKELLTRTFGMNESERAARLLHMTGLGDRTPSQLMDEMLALMNGHKPCFLFRQIFLEQMPNDIRLLLADSDFTYPRQLAARADILWHTRQQDSASINPLRTRQSASAPTRRAKDDTDKAKWCFYHRRWGSKARNSRSRCTYPGNDLAGSQ